MGTTEVSYTIELEPELNDEGEWGGVTSITLLAQAPENITDNSHNMMLSLAHRLSMVLRYFDEDENAFADFNDWYANYDVAPAPLTQ